MVDAAADSRRRASELGFARGIELEVGRVDDHIRSGELTELTDLDRRPRRLHRPAPADDEDLADPGPVDRLDCSVGRVGGGELLGRESQHARDVQRDVPVPDHHRPLAGEVEREVLEVGMAVVPGDEFGCRPGAGQVLARDPEHPVGLCAHRVDDGVVEPHQLVVLDVLADLDVAEEAEPGVERRLLERARDRLDVRVVGRHSKPDEPPRRRQALDHVDLDVEVAREQRGGRVEAGWAGTDDGDAEVVGRAHLRDATEHEGGPRRTAARPLRRLRRW